MAEGWFLQGSVHPDALLESGGDEEHLWIFQFLDDTGMTWREFENEPVRINLLRREWYIGRANARAQAQSERN